MFGHSFVMKLFFAVPVRLVCINHRLSLINLLQAIAFDSVISRMATLGDEIAQCVLALRAVQ